jgi:hypothetical protein
LNLQTVVAPVDEILMQQDEAAFETFICPSQVSVEGFQIDIARSSVLNNELIILPSGIDVCNVQLWKVLSRKEVYICGS